MDLETVCFCFLSASVKNGVKKVLGEINIFSIMISVGRTCL